MKVINYLIMVAFIMVKLKIKNLMVMDHLNGQMVNNIMVNG